MITICFYSTDMLSFKAQQKGPQVSDQTNPFVNQSSVIICGCPPPVFSLSLYDRPVCLWNNALFNWILFGGKSNAVLIIRETLKMYVCLILWICVCYVIQQCTGAEPNHLKRKKNALFNIYNPFWTVNSICSLKWWLIQSIILILFYAA